MWKKFRHVIALKASRIPLRIIYSRGMCFKAKGIKLPKGPHLILVNHQTTVEPMLLLSVLKNHCYCMIAKEFIKVKNRKKLDYWLRPVWKAKSLSDIQAVKQSLTVLREGNNLVLFPEGNRTFSGNLCHISDSTVKFIKRTKVDIAFLNFEGGYGVEPRFSLTKREGEFTLKLRKIVKKEEIAEMNDRELYNCIIENLTVQEAPSKVKVVSNKRAEKLERVLFRCPVCENLHTIYSDGNFVKCHHCKLVVEYTDNLTFGLANKAAFKYHTVNDWYEDQFAFIRKYRVEENTTIFEDAEAQIEEIEMDYENVIGKGKITLTDKKLIIGEHEFPLSSISEVTVSGKQNFLFYVDKKMYKVSSPIIGFNALKYTLMFYHIVNKSRGRDDSFLGL